MGRDCDLWESDHQATDLFSLGVNVDRDKLANEMMRNIRLEFGEDI